ncbi:MAG: aminopeptidase P family protein [Chloroflexi bacterium]|nr:aminopeptidase P family protein [Chloroflexota bacterium]
MSSRLQSLRAKLEEAKLDAILISQPENRRYLSGFAGSAGYLLVSSDAAVLATDFRYTEQASRQAPEFEVVRIQGDIPRWFPPLASRLKDRRLGFEGGDLAFSRYQKLAEAASQMEGMRLVATTDLVEALRAVKDAEEIRRIAAAVELADAAFESVASAAVAGMTEKQVAWDLERHIREHGGEAVSFDVIVASGPNSALPHHMPSDRLLREGEPVVVDLGARLEGYCSDLTRTICLGEPNETFRRVYDTVLGAQLTAQATIAAGMTGEEADRLGRVVIEQAGYGDAFGHSLGHGVGLAVHEAPRLGDGSADILMENAVFTIEPGVYLSGWGGVRIEDVVVLENKGARSLTRARKIDFGGKAR